jgi:hypothetical protein
MSDNINVEIVKGKSMKDLDVKNAHQFIHALTSGKSVEDAAELVGQTPKSLARNDEVKALLQGLPDYYFKDPEVRRMMILAKMTQILLKGDPRDSINAAKVLTSDPEMEWQNDKPVVNITISDDMLKLDKESDDLWKK